jgi:hypothetical protein
MELENERKRTFSLLRGITPHTNNPNNNDNYDSKSDFANSNYNFDKVDSILTSLHEGISKDCPLLLLLLRKLSQEVHADKINSIRKNSILLNKIHSKNNEINSSSITYNNLILPNKNEFDVDNDKYTNKSTSIENKSKNINFQKFKKINKKNNLDTKEIIEKGNSFAWII